MEKYYKMWSRWSDGKHIAFSVFFCKNGDCVLYDFSIIFHIVHFFLQNYRESSVATKEVSRDDFTKYFLSEREFLIFPHHSVEECNKKRDHDFYEKKPIFFPVKSTFLLK